MLPANFECVEWRTKGKDPTIPAQNPPRHDSLVPASSDRFITFNPSQKSRRILALLHRSATDSAAESKRRQGSVLESKPVPTCTAKLDALSLVFFCSFFFKVKVTRFCYLAHLGGQAETE